MSKQHSEETPPKMKRKKYEKELRRLKPSCAGFRNGWSTPDCE